MNLIDATGTESAEIIATWVDATYGKIARELAVAHGLDVIHVHLLFDARPISEAPRNASQRRQNAAAVLFNVHYLSDDSDYQAAYNLLESMRKLGRTKNWERAISIVEQVLETDGMTMLPRMVMFLNNVA